MEVNTAFWYVEDGSNRIVSHIKIGGRPKGQVMAHKEEVGGGPLLDIMPDDFKDDIENKFFDSVEEALKYVEQREVEQSQS